MSTRFPSNEFSLKLLPAVGPFRPQLFVATVLSFSSLPVAEPVGVTMNSMPTAFDLTVLSLRTLPVAMTLKRMPATLLPEMTFCFTVVSTLPNRRMPTRFPIKVLFLISLSIELPLSMIARVVLSRNRLSLMVFPTLPL